MKVNKVIATKDRGTALHKQAWRATVEEALEEGESVSGFVEDNIAYMLEDIRAVKKWYCSN